MSFVYTDRHLEGLKFAPKKHTVQVNFNSLAPVKFEWNFRCLIFQIISVIDGWGISCELTLRWMSLDLTDDKSALVQVMAWCHQATSHYLSQCWPKSLSPYGVTRPQWVKTHNNKLLWSLLCLCNCMFATHGTGLAMCLRMENVV